MFALELPGIYGFEQESTTFIEHPVSVPIQVIRVTSSPRQIRSYPYGGITCLSKDAFSRRQRVHVHVPSIDDSFFAEMEVLTCDPHGKKNRLKLVFNDAEQAYRLRLIEQSCHILDYQKAERQLGREVDAETAALEWIDRFASKFPGLQWL